MILIIKKGFIEKIHNYLENLGSEGSLTSERNPRSFSILGCLGIMGEGGAMGLGTRDPGNHRNHESQGRLRCEGEA